MPSSTRRRVLATAAGCLVGSLGGCLGDGSGKPTDSMTPTSTESARTPTDRTPTESPPTETLGDRLPMETPEEMADHPRGGLEGEERVTVAPENPDTSGDNYVEPVARIWNDGPDRTIGVFVRGAESGVRLDRSFEIEAGATLRIDFSGRDSYLLAVQVEGGETYGTILGRDRFFCNESWTNVQVDEAGVARAATLQTDMGCFTPTAEG